MASDSKDSIFNILGSSKLNTADGKNPTSSATTSTSTQSGTASGQKNSEEYRQVFKFRTYFLFGTQAWATSDFDSRNLFQNLASWLEEAMLTPNPA